MVWWRNGYDVWLAMKRLWVRPVLKVGIIRRRKLRNSSEEPNAEGVRIVALRRRRGGMWDEVSTSPPKLLPYRIQTASEKAYLQNFLYVLHSSAKCQNHIAVIERRGCWRLSACVHTVYGTCYRGRYQVATVRRVARTDAELRRTRRGSTSDGNHTTTTSVHTQHAITPWHGEYICVNSQLSSHINVSVWFKSETTFEWSKS